MYLSDSDDDQEEFVQPRVAGGNLVIDEITEIPETDGSETISRRPMEYGVLLPHGNGASPNFCTTYTDISISLADALQRAHEIGGLRRAGNFRWDALRRSAWGI